MSLALLLCLMICAASLPYISTGEHMTSILILAYIITLPRKH